MAGDKQASLTSFLDNKDFLDQGLYYAISSFLVFDCRLPSEGNAGRNGPLNDSDCEQDRWKKSCQWLKLAFVSVLSYIYLPFLFFPFQPEPCPIVYMGLFKGVPSFVGVIIGLFAVTSFVPASFYIAFALQSIGAILQLLRYLEVGGESLTFFARFILWVALAISVRASTRYMQDLRQASGNNLLISTVAQVLLIFLTPLVNRQIFDNEYAWTAISVLLMVVTLIFIIILHCENESSEPFSCPSIGCPSCTGACCGSLYESAKTAAKNKWNTSKKALPAIPHVFMIGSTDTLLLTVISKEAGGHEGWIKDAEEPITIISQLAVVTFSTLMRKWYWGSSVQDPALPDSPNARRRNHIDKDLKVVEMLMIVPLLSMAAMLYFKIMPGRVVLIVLTLGAQAFAALPLTLEVLQEIINGTGCGRREGAEEETNRDRDVIADACRYALGGWRMVVVYAYSYLNQWTGRPVAFFLFFLLPYITALVLKYTTASEYLDAGYLWVISSIQKMFQSITTRWRAFRRRRARMPMEEVSIINIAFDNTTESECHAVPLVDISPS